MVNSTVYENVTYKQISDMKHAIGFDKGKIRGIKHRTYEPYRNYYDAGNDNPEHLEKLVEIGFMSFKRNEYSFGQHIHNIYWVTDDGRLFLKLVTGVEILPEMD